VAESTQADFGAGMMSKHQWSGWPGAFCLKCGQHDMSEIAIGRGDYDPYTDTWAAGINPSDYSNGDCPVSGPKYHLEVKRV